MEYVMAWLIGAGIVAAAGLWGWLAGAAASTTAAPSAGMAPEAARPPAQPMPAARVAQARLAALVSGHRQWAEAAQVAAQNGIRSPRQS